MNKKRILTIVAVVIVIIPVLVGLYALINMGKQYGIEQQQLEFRESVNNYVPNLDMEAYLKEKERWNLEPSAPVSEYGMMNVNGLASLVIYYDEDDKERITPAMTDLLVKIEE